MDARSAIVAAKKVISEAFGDENIRNVGLEEVVFDEKEQLWRITIGFSRPWDVAAENALTGIFGQSGQAGRTYRVVSIKDADGTFKSIRLRDSYQK